MKAVFVIHSEQHALNAHQAILRNWQAVKAAGDVLEVNICLHKSARNLEQNKRLHAMLQEIADQVWQDGRQYSMEMWKEFYKRKFLQVWELPNGEIMSSPTHKLKTRECAEFMQRIEAHAVSEFGVVFGVAA